MAGGNRTPGRTVTSKVIAVLGAFEKSTRPLGLTEIADLADLPASTTHRLLNELTEGGLLSRKSDGRYQLVLRSWELAQNTGRQLRDTAKPYVQNFYSFTGETSQLVVRDHNEALLIERVYGSKKVPRSSRVGGRPPCIPPRWARSSWPSRNRGCGRPSSSSRWRRPRSTRSPTLWCWSSSSARSGPGGGMPSPWMSNGWGHHPP